MRTYPNQVVLFAVNACGGSTAIAANAEPAHGEIQEEPFLAEWLTFKDGDALPERPGLYVWEGALTMVPHYYSFHWTGTWRPATWDDLLQFGITAEVLVVPKEGQKNDD